MSVEITYLCSGCWAKETVRRVSAKRIVDRAGAIVVDGMARDRTHIETPTIESAAPNGWMVFDPYTQCTYCPTCWASIESDEQVEMSMGGHQ